MGLFANAAALQVTELTMSQHLACQLTCKSFVCSLRERWLTAPQQGWQAQAWPRRLPRGKKELVAGAQSKMRSWCPAQQGRLGLMDPQWLAGHIPALAHEQSYPSSASARSAACPPLCPRLCHLCALSQTYLSCGSEVTFRCCQRFMGPTSQTE